MTNKLDKSNKTFFSYVNSKRKAKQSVVSVKNSTGHLATSPQETADILADFFESTFTQSPSTDISTDYATTSGSTTFNFSELQEN